MWPSYGLLPMNVDNSLEFKVNSKMSMLNSESHASMYAHKFQPITLFRSITVLRGTDDIMKNIPHIQSEHGDIMHNDVSPMEQCYGYK